MQKSSLKLISLGLILIFILSACGTSGSRTETPNTDIAKLESEIKEKDIKIMDLEIKIEEQNDMIKELEANEDTSQTIQEPKVEILSFDEAQDLLNNWYEWKNIYYIPYMDKQVEGVWFYGFLVDYSDSESEFSGNNYCYAWVNPSKEMINFEEAGYSEKNGPNFYANIPDSMFPIPMRKGVVIPYDRFSPPDYVWGVSYSYEDKSVMKSYQAQLKDAGFIDLGTVQSVESLWQYEQESDGAVFTVEMYNEGETFNMNMYINTF